MPDEHAISKVGTSPRVRSSDGRMKKFKVLARTVKRTGPKKMKNDLWTSLDMFRTLPCGLVLDVVACF